MHNLEVDTFGGWLQRREELGTHRRNSQMNVPSLLPHMLITAANVQVPDANHWELNSTFSLLS